MRAGPTILLPVLVLVALGAWLAFAAPNAPLVPSGGDTGLEDRAAAVVATGHAIATVRGAESTGDGAGADDRAGDPEPDPDHAHRVATARSAGRLLQHGAPLAQAEVLCCSGSSWQPTVLARTRSSADGRFELPTQQTPCWLAVVHERAPLGWRSATVSIRRDPGDIDVPAPGTIVGRVRDAEGNAVVAARVVGEVSSYVFAVIDGQPLQPESVTDREGAFRLQRVQPGKHQLRCDSPGFAVASGIEIEVLAGVESTSEIVLQRGVQLHGLVLDWHGQPLAGAAVRAEDGRTTDSDALGRFTFVHFRRGDDLGVSAPGHLQRDLDFVHDVDQPVTVQLERAVTLRGVVHGTAGKPGTLRIEPRDSVRPDASHTMPYRLVYEDLDVVRDGCFAVGGLSCAAFDLIVTVPGVGKVGPVRVEVDGDTAVELTLVPAQQVELVLRDQQAQPIEQAQLAVDPRAQRYPSLYRPDATLAARILKNEKLLPISAPGGRYSRSHPRGEALAFVVQADGCLPVARSFAAGEVPDRVELTMVRAGAVRGVVIGGDRTTCAARFEFWPAGMDPAAMHAEELAMQAHGLPRQWPRDVAVQDDGSFAAERVPAGDYRGALARSNTRRATADTTGVPLVDGGADHRVEVRFSVVAGQTTAVEIATVPLGVLCGRVLLRGAPTAGVAVLASRPKPPGHERQPVFGIDDGDWDNEITRDFAAGQLSDADGGFGIRYRDAGPVELRVRHPEGHATSPPLVVVLPPPGAAVVRDLHVPVGEIRGRFPVEEVPGDARKDYRVTLFPLTKAGDDPFYSAGDYSSPIAWHCEHHEGLADGAFAFSFLPPGQWIVRVHSSVFGGHLLWQQVVEVQHGLVDLGDIVVQRPPVALAWQWAGGDAAGAEVRGLWLWRLIGDPPQRVWAATLGGSAASCDLLEPGRYEVQPFGTFEWNGWTSSHGFGGPPIAAPVSITIASDGEVEPPVMTFVPLPKAQGK